jgi:hypothetical protein
VVNHVEILGNRRSIGSRAPGEQPNQEHQRNKGCVGVEYALEPNRQELPMAGLCTCRALPAKNPLETDQRAVRIRCRTATKTLPRSRRYVQSTLPISFR